MSEVTDIVPGLKEKIEKTFAESVAKDKTILEIQEKIAAKTATYQDAQDYAGRVGRLLADAFQENIRPEDLPNGTFYYNMANRIVPPAMQTNYEMISDVCCDVQDILNEAAGLGINAQKAPFNEDRVRGIVERVVADEFEKTKWLLDYTIENAARSVVDDHIKANADFHYQSGLRPKIVRKSDGKCCEWCSERVGVYDYSPDMDHDIFRRHENCGCTLEYDPADGSRRRQDAWKKKWS